MDETIERTWRKKRKLEKENRGERKVNYKAGRIRGKSLNEEKKNRRDKEKVRDYRIERERRRQGREREGKEGALHED